MCAGNVLLSILLLVLASELSKMANKECGGERFITIPRSTFKPIAEVVCCVADLRNMFEEDLAINFMFRTLRELQDLIQALGLSSSNDMHDEGFKFQVGNRQVVSSVVAFLAYLYRLSFKCTSLKGVGDLFGFSVPTMSAIMSAMGFWLYDRYNKHAFKLQVMVQPVEPLCPSFNAAVGRRFKSAYEKNGHAAAFQRKYVDENSPFPPEIVDTVLLMDGCHFKTCRPSQTYGDAQRFVYDGRSGHGFSVLAFVAPNGLCYGFAGPSTGTNDLGMMRDYHAAHYLASLGTYKSLGDSIFVPGANVVNMPDSASSVGRDRHDLGAIQSVRGEVEHMFLIKQRFPYFSDRMKLRWSSKPFLHLLNAVFLQNIWVCLHENQTSQAFGCVPPNWRDYIQEQYTCNQV